MKKIKQTSSETLDPEVEESIKKLAKPIAKLEYKDKDSVEISSDDYQLQFDYSLIDDENEEDVYAFMDNLRRKEFSEDHWDFNAWRQINRLEIKPNNSEKAIDVLAAMPSGYKLFFCPSEDLVQATATGSQKKIYLIGNMAAPKSIAVILHEIGHTWDNKKLEELGIDKLTDEHKHSEVAERIRKERMASAFALKVMRPFMSTEQRKDVINFLKHYALGGYNFIAKQETADLSGSMDHYARDYEYTEEEERSQWMWDEWIEFKNSNEYAKWKALDEFKDLDEYEEYGAWYEWIEKKWEAENK